MLGVQIHVCSMTDPSSVSKWQQIFKNYTILQVKAAVLDPENEFNVERTLTKEDVHKLIQVQKMIRLQCIIN